MKKKRTIEPTATPRSSKSSGAAAGATVGAVDGATAWAVVGAADGATTSAIAGAAAGATAGVTAGATADTAAEKTADTGGQRSGRHFKPAPAPAELTPAPAEPAPAPAELTPAPAEPAPTPADTKPHINRKLPTLETQSSSSVKAVPVHPSLVRKKKRPLRIILLVFSSILTVALAAYIAISIYFMDHFVFNTSINDIDCTRLSVDEVDGLIRKQMEDYRLEIHTRENLVIYISGPDIDMAYVYDGSVQKLLDLQNGFHWPLYYLGLRSVSHTHVSFTYDGIKLMEMIDAFAIMDQQQMREPKDAYIEFIPPDYIIQPEVMGTTLDGIKTHQTIVVAVSALALKLDLEEAGCYIDPQLFSDSVSLVELQEAYNTYAPFSITYTLGDKTVVLDARTAIEWVVVGETTPGELDRSSVAAWVYAFADEHDTVGKARTIINGWGEEKFVDVGPTFGWRINREAEINAIIETCRNRAADIREPIYSQRAISPGMYDWGNTYIEVDTTVQHMWYFVNGELVLDCDVVTGFNNGTHNTPPGMFKIHAKQSPSVLMSGTNPETGGPMYITPVSFWMPFYNNFYGFHDANWQPWFGGDRYNYAGSGGCVNMPYDKAAQLYSLVEVGTIVLIHF